jgi:membrane fusion protein (multidrug efflux system)
MGEFVSTGSPLFSIVNTKHFWIEANYKETDLTYIRPNQKAIVTIDAYPDKQWKATVASITPASGAEFSILPPQNSSGNWVKVVQRVMVKLEFDDYDPTSLLVAGMSANVTIDTKHSRISRFFTAK